MNVTVIGVAGGTGSGKSTLVKRLQEAFVGDDVVTLCHDYYYKAHPELTYEERTKLNYDHPQAFDTEMLVEHIKALKNNVPIEHPVYSFVDHDRTSESVSVKPSKVIIVDGNTTELGSYNFSASAANRNSENVLVNWDNPELARVYLSHFKRNYRQSEPYNTNY